MKLDPTVFSDPFSFQDYTLLAGERSDLTASAVYDDPYMEWLVFMSNKQIDPYKWYMNTDEFYDYVNQKYGDWLIAQQKVMYYTNNWYNENASTLMPGAFDALEPSQAKYFEPVYDYSGNIINYKRREVNWQMTTNYIVKCYFTASVPTLVQDELMSIRWDNNVVGNGQVTFSNSSALYFHHVLHNYQPINNVVNNSVFVINGLESGADITLAGGNVLTYEVVEVTPRLEQTFFDSVSYFDYENQLNESRRQIVVIDPGYASQIVTEFDRAF